MSDNVVTLNKNKKTEFEFEVGVDGPAQLISKTSVRFVVKNVADNMDCVFEAKKDSDNIWKVSFPAVDHFLKNEYKFVVEVFVEDYFFKAAEGKVEIISEPAVNLNRKKQIKEERLTEAVTQNPPGQMHPNNALLTPEEKPEDTHIEKKREIDKAICDIAANITPGDGAQYPQDVIEKKGIIFKRVRRGRPVIEDADAVERRKQQKTLLEAKRKEKSKRVKEILKELT